jgi:carotenoid cleavage dioxygenase-like enzyme
MTARYATGFTTQAVELTAVPLDVQGVFPRWLNGTLIRNGPGQFEVGSTPIRHWFDGLAMLHSFHIVDGSVNYSNRFLRTNAYYKDRASGTIHYVGFAQDPCRALFRKVMSIFFAAEPGNNALINVARYGDRFVAMTESPLTVTFDPRTLRTLGVLDYHDNVTAFTATAHPHYDPRRRAGINLLTNYGQRTAYQIYSITDTQRRKLGEFVRDDISYIHSFALTPRYAIVAEFSLRLKSPLALLASGKPFIQNFRYLPHEDARFTVLDLESGQVVADVRADAFFCFHHVNAYEDADAVVVDVVAYDDASLIDMLYIDHLRRAADVKLGQLRRYRLPLGGGRAAPQPLSDAPLELPRINYRFNGQPYRCAYGTASRPDAPEFMNALVKVDVVSGSCRYWHEDWLFPGEPVFVAAPDAVAEDDGVILTVALDARTGTSALVVLDAASFTETGRAVLPQHVPFGFHGHFYGDLT